MSDLIDFDEPVNPPTSLHITPPSNLAIPCVSVEPTPDNSRFCLFYVRNKQLFPSSKEALKSTLAQTLNEDPIDRLLSSSPSTSSPSRDSVKASPHFFGEDQAIHPICLNIPTAEEIRLRSFVASKLYSHEVFTNGNIYLLQERNPDIPSAYSGFAQSDFSAITVCYYCAIPLADETVSVGDTFGISSSDASRVTFSETGHLLLKKSTRSGRDILEDNANDFYVVCLLKDFDNEDGFESFRPELDEFCSGPLRKELLNLKLDDFDVPSSLQNLLKQWYSKNINYVGNSVDICAPILEYVIHGIMTFAPIKIIGSSEHSSSLKKFIGNVQMPFFAFRGDDTIPESDVEIYESSVPGSSSSLLGAHSSKEVPPIVIDVTNPVHPRISPQLSNEFCSQWASELQTYRGDPLRIRKIIQLYQMKVTQEMNRINRSLKKAETDNYELYKCYMMVKDNPNQDILSQLLFSGTAKQEPTREEVIDVLRTYLDIQGKKHGASTFSPVGAS